MCCDIIPIENKLRLSVFKMSIKSPIKVFLSLSLSL